MSAARQSLRMVVNKWIAARSEGNVCLTRPPHAQLGAGRFVCVQVTHRDRAFTIFFSVTKMARGEYFLPKRGDRCLTLGES